MNDPHENATWVYNYDRGDNILSKVKYAYTTGAFGSAVETIPYSYDDSNWKDKLTAYNDTAITYDAIGNPLNDGTWAYTWNAGRQLQTMTKSDATVEFKYDHNGLRVGKLVTENGVTTTANYTLHGKLITHMTVDYRDTAENAHQDVLHFFYDASGCAAKVQVNGTSYTDVHNLQGDIVGLLDSNGNLIVEYKYDAWGKPISTVGSLADTLGKLNPFRYRGYVYDEVTGLYYLRSRYYNPTVGRFVNADSCLGKISVLGQHNQFSYCANVPVGLHDESGQNFLSELKRFGKQLAYNYLYSSQIKFWNNVCLALYAMGYEYSAELLNHSLQPEPARVVYSNDSALAEKIRNDSDFKKKMSDMIENHDFNAERSMSFDSDFDLFGSLHSVSLVVSPVTIDGVDMYHVYMTDTYDFKYESDYSSQSTSWKTRVMKAGAIAGNNLAYFDLNRGAINEYKIAIDFYVE